MKMIKFSILFSLLLVYFLYGGEDYAIFDSRNGEIIDLNELAVRVSDFDICFFGEFHDDSLLHELEAGFLPLLDDQTDDLAISMEMFERDVQFFVDAYLSGEIDETEFLGKSRPWPNYETGYKALIEYARENNKPVIAANIPRRYAAMLRKQGWDAIENLPGDERLFIATELMVLEDEYKQKFTATMMANMSSREGMPGKMMDIDGFYKAQCIKDDTMAESILTFYRKHPEYHVIHYNGDFHSNSHLGTAQKLSLLAPELKIAVITPVSILPEEDIQFSEDRRNEGDFLIVIK